MSRLIEFAPAKINLSLRILGRRSDGFHALQSIVAFASVGDHLSMDLTAAPGIDLTGPFASAIVGDNIVTRACDAVRKAAPQARIGRITIEKNLPVAAGLGGGSADAAAVLRLIQRANPDLKTAIDWRSLAASLGADVPACLHNTAAWIEGTGTSVTPIVSMPKLHAVLVNTRDPVPADKTRQIFAALNAPAVPAGTPEHQPPPQFRNAADLIGYLQRAANDLEAPACRALPATVTALDALRAQKSCQVVRMSGAGPTCFGIAASAAAAAAIAANLSAAHPGWWIMPTVIG
jgi:4-diphosphocytidyl-2-C-methyl-D-erythritol kinase